MGIIGIAVIFLIAFALSTNRKSIDLRTVGTAFALQLSIAVFVFFVPIGRAALSTMARSVEYLMSYSNAGIQFLFGGLASDSMGFVFVIQVLPTIVFFSALMAVLYHIGLMQLMVKIIGQSVRFVIGTSRVESFVAAGSIFFDLSQTALMVRPYVGKLSQPQFFTVMCCGLASVSGSILAGYASLGISLEFLIPASFMAAPGGLLMAKMLMPSDKLAPEADIDIEISTDEERASNIIHAASRGALDGMKLALAVGATLMAFIALVSLVNGMMGGIGSWFGVEDLTLEKIFGYVLSPLVFILGIPWDEAPQAASFVGQKVILNEFVALANFSAVQDSFSHNSRAIITFALCGFANLTSIAVLLGSLGSVAPARVPEIAKLGLLAVAAGTLSNFMSASIVSVLLSLQ